MKAKNLWLVLITLVFFGCDDNTGGLGMGMLPDSDGITVKTKTFDVQTASSLFGEKGVYAKTDIGYVGRFTDNEYGFGSYEGSFFTELNCVDSLTFPKVYDREVNKSINNMISENMISDNLDESLVDAYITLGYYNFFGDSLNPMRINVYKIADNKKLNTDHYTAEIDPSEYIGEGENRILLGTKTFSAVDLADSTRYSDANYIHQVEIPFPVDRAKEIIRRNWDHPEYFYDSETFIEDVFEGLYIESDMGDGTVLYIKHTALNILYRGYVTDSIGDIIKKHNSEVDSTYIGSRTFASTMEVTQANRIDLSGELIDKVEDAEEQGWTYLKSPAGIYTRAVLPIGDIMNKAGEGIDMERDTINAVKLVFNAYHHETENKYSMSPPATVLLIKENQVKDFFQKNLIPNNTTSYIAYYSNNKYEFTNIMRLVTALAQEMEAAKTAPGWTNVEDWEEKNALAIIPVVVGTSSSSGAITNVIHDLKPTYVKLKGGDPNAGGHPLELQVVYSRFNQ